MFLNDMTTVDLRTLLTRLRWAETSMLTAVEGGFAPRLSMMPGEDAFIVLGPLMPPDFDHAEFELEPMPVPQGQGLGDLPVEWTVTSAAEGPSAGPSAEQAQTAELVEAEPGELTDLEIDALARQSIAMAASPPDAFFEDPDPVPDDDIPAGLPVEAEGLAEEGGREASAAAAVEQPLQDGKGDEGPALPVAAPGPVEQAEAAPVAGGAAPIAPPAAAPPVALPAASAVSGFDRPWTDAEDERLMSIVVSQMVNAAPKLRAIAFAATEIGRTESATSARIYGRLKERFATKLEEARRGAAAPVAPPPPPTAKAEPVAPAVVRAVEPGPAGGGGAGDAAPKPEKLSAQGKAPAATKPDYADPVIQHLTTLPDKGGWSLADSLTLIEGALDGWSMEQIAVDLGRDGKAVRERFDALTKLYQDANGKNVRMFTREKLREALLVLLTPADVAPLKKAVAG